MEQPRQLTRELVEGMDEATLRKEVLIPLFRAMGLNGVHEYHGSGERGKDIIMWSADQLGQRVNYAVIVVAERISGNARGGRGSAAKVFFQVREALGSKYKDLLLLTEQQVDQCWIVTSKTVKTDARESIAAALDRDIRSVRVVDGDELWQLVEKYLKPQLLSGKLKDVHQSLAVLSSKFTIDAHAGGEDLTFTLTPKPDMDGSTQSVDFVAKFEFPDTEEGNEAKSVLEEHLRTGIPVAIPAKFMGDAEISDLIQSVAGNEASELYSLVLGPRGAGAKVHTDVVVEHLDGSIHKLSSITLTVVHAGTDEVRLVGSRVGLPMRLEIVIHDQQLNLRVESHIVGANVKQQAEILSFSAALARGGVVKCLNTETEAPVVGGEILANLWPSPPPLVIRVVNDLLAIQRATGLLFGLPEEFSADEARTVLEIAQILKTGVLRLDQVELGVPVARDVAERMLTELGKPESSFYLRSQEEQTTDLFGQAIVLGRAEAILPQAFIPEGDRKRLSRQLAAGKQKVFTVKVRAPKDSAAVLRYDRWLSKNEREKYPGIESTRSLDG